MKKRIQYLYEKGGDDAWFQMMLNAENLSDLLTKAEYTQKTYEQDRKSLEKYSNTIQQVANLEAQYTQEKAELEGTFLQSRQQSFSVWRQSVSRQKRKRDVRQKQKQLQEHRQRQKHRPVQKQKHRRSRMKKLTAKKMCSMMRTVMRS